MKALMTLSILLLSPFSAFALDSELSSVQKQAVEDVAMGCLASAESSAFCIQLRKRYDRFLAAKACDPGKIWSIEGRQCVPQCGPPGFGFVDSAGKYVNGEPQQQCKKVQ